MDGLDIDFYQNGELNMAWMSLFQVIQFKSNCRVFKIDFCRFELQNFVGGFKLSRPINLKKPHMFNVSSKIESPCFEIVREESKDNVC